MATSTVKIGSQAHYITGDTITIRDVFGYVTNSGKDLNLFVPVGKARPNNSGYDVVGVSSSTFKISLRRGETTGGYVGGSSGVDIKSYLNTINWWAGYIQIVFRKDAGWGVTNNTPVAGFVEATLSFGLW